MRKPRSSGAFSFGGEGDLDENPRFDRSAGSRSARAQRVRRTRPRDGPRNPSFSAMIKPRSSGAFSFGGEGDLDENPRFDRSAGSRSARAQRVRRTRPRDGPRNPSFSAMIKPRSSGAFSFGGEGDLDKNPRFDDWARTAQSDAGAQRRRRAAARARMARVYPSFSAMIKPRTRGAFSFGGGGGLDQHPRFYDWARQSPSEAIDLLP